MIDDGHLISGLKDKPVLPEVGGRAQVITDVSSLVTVNEASSH